MTAPPFSSRPAPPPDGGAIVVGLALVGAMSFLCGGIAGALAMWFLA